VAGGAKQSSSYWGKIRSECITASAVLAGMFGGGGGGGSRTAFSSRGSERCWPVQKDNEGGGGERLTTSFSNG